MTTEDYIFGVLTDSKWGFLGTTYKGPNSFVFSVNEQNKYPIASADHTAIRFEYKYCALFGTDYKADLYICSNSNSCSDSWCVASMPSFKLPPSKNGEYGSSVINGGKTCFTSKEIEVYQVIKRSQFKTKERRKK